MKRAGGRLLTMKVVGEQLPKSYSYNSDSHSAIVSLKNESMRLPVPPTPEPACLERQIPSTSWSVRLPIKPGKGGNTL